MTLTLLPVWLSMLHWQVDVRAASLVLSRVAPTLKGQSERVNFDFGARTPMTLLVQQVLQAIADGQVFPDISKQIIDLISALPAIKQFDRYDAW